MRIAMALLALALATGCKKKETKPAETAGSGSAMVGSDMGSGSAMAGSGSDMGSGSAMAGSDAGSGSAMAGSAAADTAMAKKAGMCPSTVLGTTTRAEVKGKTVVLTISADDADAAKAVQTRAQLLLKEKADKVTGTAHDQKGTHGGASGLCPVYVPEGATATYKKAGKGATITITPKDKPEDLKTEIDARITKAAEWVKANIKPGDKGNQGGVGGLKNNEGGNHAGQGDGKGMERTKAGDGSGGGKGTGGGGSKGTGGGGGAGSAGSGSATK